MLRHAANDREMNEIQAEIQIEFFRDLISISFPVHLRLLPRVHLPVSYTPNISLQVCELVRTMRLVYTECDWRFPKETETGTLTELFENAPNAALGVISSTRMMYFL